MGGGLARPRAMSAPTDNGYGTLFPTDWGEPAHEAIYYDADGTEVFRKLRWSRVEEGKRKTIRQCHWDGGKWVAKLPNRKLPLYRLPDLLANPEKPILSKWLARYRAGGCGAARPRARRRGAADTVCEPENRGFSDAELAIRDPYPILGGPPWLPDHRTFLFQIVTTQV